MAIAGRFPVAPVVVRRSVALLVTSSVAAALSGCSSASRTPPPPVLVISTTTLANGTVGTPYSAQLAATGGTAPYTWALTKGTLPAGLSLTASTGAIAGTPTAATNAASLTFMVTDSGTPAQTQAAALSLTIAALPITVTIAPARAAIVVHQALSLTPSTSDGSGVNWSVTGSNCGGSACGALSASSSGTGVPAVYTAPGAAGIYTVTATSWADSTKSASIQVAVTDLAGVTTWHNDAARDGANAQEYALTPAAVSSAKFGKLVSCAVDGAIYAQPLWLPQLTVGSAVHNVVFVATQHDSLYAFDADSASGGCQTLWHVSLIDPAHGGTAGETTVVSGGANSMVGQGFGDIAPEVGITGTPVIDVSSHTLYVVSKSVIPATMVFFQRLHAIDVLTGAEKFAGPATIAATYPGSGDGGATTTFVARQQNQRAGLALANGTVYIAWSSHEDNYPYYGWVMGYDAHSLAQVGAFNDTPDAGWGGIWMGGAAPSVDAAGNLFLITGNGQFDADSATPPNRDFGDSLLKLTPGLAVSEYFTPSDQASDQANDADFGSGGTAILVDLPASGSNPTHLVIGGGKDGSLYLLNRDNVGGSGDSNAWQQFNAGAPIFSTGAFWNSTFYIAGQGGPLSAFSLNAATAKMNPAASSASSNAFGFPGATPSVSASGTGNGVLWALDNSQYCTSQSPGCGAAVLHAYDAANLGKELWNSSQQTQNAAGYAVKFTVPTVANGRVYIGTRGNDTGAGTSSASTPGELDIYGLLPN